MDSASENQQHNKFVYDQLKTGDRVEFKRPLYSHWGLYIGSGKIAHLAAANNGGIKDTINSKQLSSIIGLPSDKAAIRTDDFWAVAAKDKAFINNSRDKTWRSFDPETIKSNATQNIGKIGYNVFNSNCEHFVNWCRYGKKESDQVANACTGVVHGIQDYYSISP
ncbi:Phospholipase A and acyltransferase 3 [Bulinus truncatus]|nr:Phospholipase A and acyltransferase 3 [Bulinus truncatus]